MIIPSYLPETASGVTLTGRTAGPSSFDILGAKGYTELPPLLDPENNVVDASLLAIPTGYSSKVSGFYLPNYIPAIAPSYLRLKNTNNFKKIFRDITAAEAVAGVTLSTSLFLNYTGNGTTNVTNLKVSVTQPVNTATTKSAIKIYDPVALSWVDGSTAVTYSTSFTPTSHPLFLGVQWKVTAGAGNKCVMNDYFELVISSDNYDSEIYRFFINSRQNLHFLSVTATTGRNISVGNYITWTATIANSSNVATDPDINIPAVVTTIDHNNIPVGIKTPRRPSSLLELSEMSKVSTGIYNWNLTPQYPGMYAFTFTNYENTFNTYIKVKPNISELNYADQYNYTF